MPYGNFDARALSSKRAQWIGGCTYQPLYVTLHRLVLYGQWSIAIACQGQWYRLYEGTVVKGLDTSLGVDVRGYCT